MITIRPEGPQDIAAIHHVNEQAFKGNAEAELVDRLRAEKKLVISLVAVANGNVVGHIAFSRVEIDSSFQVSGIGLAPLAVQPGMQNLGIGSQLVNAGLEMCRDLRFDYVVVLGHPSYYPRFGFTPASRFGIRCIWSVADEVFMALELRPGALQGVTGIVNYDPLFTH
ncbi:MAG: N-acetyltransferase [Acidobacteria bacterium]|nr:N-acetyltransferase [Acidobacteriota bacterium]